MAGQVSAAAGPSPVPWIGRRTCKTPGERPEAAVIGSSEETGLPVLTTMAGRLEEDARKPFSEL
jgi:hypothetical protein